jgi:hypothetical protein
MKPALLLFLVALPVLVHASEIQSIKAEQAKLTSSYKDQTGQMHLICDTFVVALFRGLIINGVINIDESWWAIKPTASAKHSGINTIQQDTVKPDEIKKDEPWLELQSISQNATESNTVFTRVEWKATVNNPTKSRKHGYLDINLIDNSGSVLEYHPGPAVDLDGYEIRTYSGDVLFSRDEYDRGALIQIVLKKSIF